MVEPPGVTDVAPLAQPEDRSALSDRALHWDNGFGIDAGRLNAGNMTGTYGFHGVFGPRINRFSLLAELDLAETHAADNSTMGTYERVAIEPRVAIWRGRAHSVFGMNELSRVELWVEPGLGYELASQQLMPSISRKDASLTFGFARSWHYTDHSFGSYFAVRGMEADPLPGEHRRDYSVLFTSGLVFGR